MDFIIQVSPVSRRGAPRAGPSSGRSVLGYNNGYLLVYYNHTLRVLSSIIISQSLDIHHLAE